MAGVLRRIVVLALTAGACWLAWERQAPAQAEWLQPLLTAIQEGFDEAGLKPSLGRAYVGAGAGALLAFLLGGGLWRPGRVFAMLVLLGGAAAAGWYLSNEQDVAAWLARELNINGETPTILVSLASAALLLGLYDLLRPGRPNDAPRIGFGTVLWRLTVLLLLIAGGWLAWGEIAPAHAEWLQPALDIVQEGFNLAPLDPPWARVLAGVGTAGLLAFMIGGGLWRFGRFCAMLFVVALGAGAGWGLTMPPIDDWLAREAGIKDLVPSLVLGLAGAGTLLGLIEWLAPRGQRGSVPGFAASAQNLGFKFAPGKYTAQLAGADRDYDRAIASIVALAEKGDRSGLDEIDGLIRDNCSVPVDFHQPGLRMFMGTFNADKVIAQFVEFARGPGLFANAKAVQQEISQLAMFNRLGDAMNAIQLQAGTRERRCFQLLFEQLRVHAAYAKSKR